MPTNSINRNSQSTKAETSRRVGIILELIVAGYTRRQIIKIISESDKFAWNVGHRQIDAYIGAAYKEIQNRLEKDKDKIVASQIARYETLYNKLFALKDYRAAITPLDRISELYKLKNITILHEGNPEKPIEIQTRVILPPPPEETAEPPAEPETE